MNGYEVARALRRDKQLRSAYLVALTGYQRAECEAQASDAGFDEVLTKPVDIERLEAVLRSRSSAQPR
jgi:CheY-like chemotaxis protein